MKKTQKGKTNKKRQRFAVNCMTNVNTQKIATKKNTTKRLLEKWEAKLCTLSDSCIHEVKLVKSKKALSRGTKKAGRGSFSFTNHWPIIFLLMLNTYCTSVELISFFMSALF